VKDIAFTAAAARQLKKLDRHVATQIRSKLDAYAERGAGNVTPMLGAGLNVFRLRIGDFRAVFEESETEILVLAVGSPARGV
jgi:mRNA interferase RelE/StbE